MPRKPKQAGISVTFNADVKVLDHNKEIEQSFKAGETVTLNTASAMRWINRGLAVEAAEKPAAAKPAAAPPTDAGVGDSGAQ